MSGHVCGTIQYMEASGPVHSDICFDGKPTTEQREFLHACLDEWLNKQSGGNDEAFLLGDHRVFYPDEWDIDLAASMIKDEIFAMPGNVPEDDGAVKAAIRDGIKRLLS